jgi:hypothetical protein
LARPQDAIQDYTQAITFLEGPIQENGTHELRTFGTKDRILELEAPTNQPTLKPRLVALCKIPTFS